VSLKDSKEADEAECEENDASDEQELLGIHAFLPGCCRRGVRKEEARWFTAGLFLAA